MLEALGVRNLRSLVQEHSLRVRPINILVGANSSGKSTFARLLPLLRQSVEHRTRGPILWWGRLVDFGGFSDAINAVPKDDSILFSFTLRSGEHRHARSISFGPRWRQLNPFLFPSSIDVELEVKQLDETDTSYTSAVKLKMYGNSCLVKFKQDGYLEFLKVNDFEWKPESDRFAVLRPGHLVPSFEILPAQRTEDQKSRLYPTDDPLETLLDSQIRDLIHGNTMERTRHRIAYQLNLGDDESLLTELQQIDDAPQSWYVNTKDFSPENTNFQSLRNRLYASRLETVLVYIDNLLQEFLVGVRYMEPLRATAQRHYRQQDLAIDEIDSKGANVALYLDSLGERELEDLRKWTDHYLGFAMETAQSGGHISVHISPKLGDDKKTNIADMGFGLSQLLPIVLQLWSGAHEQRRSPALSRSLPPTTAFVIEQPELHLHPVLQSKTADLFAAFCAKTQKTIPLIVETHSPHIINRLGELVSSGAVKQEDVGVSLFEIDSDLRRTQITESEFDKDGVLKNWPYGFFEPSSLD